MPNDSLCLPRVTKVEIEHISLVLRDDMYYHEASIIINARNVWLHESGFGATEDERNKLGLRCDGEKWRIYSWETPAGYQQELCNQGCP